MNTRWLGAFLALAVWSASAETHAEMRVFTSTTGQTMKGELLSTKGDEVTIRWENGQTVTLKTSVFCGADNAYFKKHSTTSATADNAALPAGGWVIEAYIDGPSELRIRTDGIYWVNGRNAKPGKHEGHNFPTYVGQEAWLPVWPHPESRGKDTSEPHAMKVSDPGHLEFKLLMVGKERDSTGIEKRDEIKVAVVGQELSILIPDKQSGARWYRFALIPMSR